MAYEVLARKWRPKTFDDVVGQAHVTRTLMNAIKNDRIANAYLFIGPRGIGKTTLSRIFAMALNCPNAKDTGEPCGQCETCKAIASGADIDVIELDAASNNKVDDIHLLLDQARFAPAHNRFKIFILDEVHMLSSSAFNALLKTLEEPPSYLRFIFATTEGDKVLPTIISRCQRFDLRRITTSDIVKRLQFICNAEQIEISEDALLAIARGANGGLRDALSALDQLIAFKGVKLTEEDVLAVFGLVSREALEGLANAVLTGDIPAILKSLDEFESAGKDMRRLTAELLWHFRNLLVYQQAGAELAKQDVMADQLATLEKQSKLITPGRIVEITGMLADMEGKLRSALSVRTVVEMTLIRAARAASTYPVEELIRRITEIRAQIIQHFAATASQDPVAAPAAQPRAASQSQQASAPRPADLPAAPAVELDDEEGEFEPCQTQEPSVPAPVAAPPKHAEALPASDGRYVDEILNSAIKIFGGGPTSFRDL